MSENLNQYSTSENSASEGQLNNCLLSQEMKSEVELALNYSPSGGNSKPFQWKWMSDYELHITHDNQLALHYLNRNNHTSYLALGCLLTSVEVVADKLNLAVETQIDEVALSTKVKFVNKTKMSSLSFLYSVIGQRSTYRGKFKKQKQTASAFKSDTFFEGQEVISREYKYSESLNSAFIKFLLETESYMWVQKKALIDFLSEIRFFSNKSSKEQRKIASFELGVSIVDQILLASLKRVPWLLSLMRQVPILNLPMKANVYKSVKNANFCLFRSQSLKPQALIEVGKVAMLTWLELEKQGYKVQPMSLSSIPVLDSLTGHLPDDTKASFTELFQRQSLEVFNGQFSENQELKPVWLFRFGVPK